MERKITHDPWPPTQDAFVHSDERFTAFIGGIGAGKTRGGAIKALRWLRDWGLERPSVGLVVAPTYRMLADVAVRTYCDVFPIRRFNKADFIAHFKRAEILFRSADNPDSLRGPNIHWAHIDEAALCDGLTFDIVMGRLRADGIAGPLWITTTPKGRNWVWQRVQDGTLKAFYAPTKDNPHLHPDFVAALERAYAGDFARQELYAEFVSFEGLIYSGFRREVHVRERALSEFTQFVIGCDEGYTNPSVALVVGLDSDGRAHVCEEFYRRSVLQEAFVAEVVRLYQAYRPYAVYVDASAAGLIAAMVAAGLPAYAARSEVMTGIRAIQARLQVAGDGRPRLTVSPRCANTIAEFESYVWAKGRDGVLLDRPEKQNDHAMDALRYALSGAEYTHAQIVII